MTRRARVDPRAAAMTEAQLEEAVRALCADLGVRRFHVRNSRGMAAGWPDDVLIGAQGILYRELKSEHGILSAEQREVGEAITRGRGNWRVWRPSDLLAGRIAAELTEIAAAQMALFSA
jgi:hypothetical protein